MLRSATVEDEEAAYHVLRRDVGAFRVIHNRYPPRHTIPEHEHATATIYLVLTGGHVEHNATKAVDCARGSVVFSPAGARHTDAYGAAAVRRCSSSCRGTCSSASARPARTFLLRCTSPRLHAFDVLDGATGELLVRYGPDELSDPRRQRASIWIDTEPGAANLKLAAGRTTTIAVDLTLGANAPVPQSLRHRLTFEPDPSLSLRTDAGDTTSELVAESAVLPIDPRTPPVLLPPLRGGDWMCGNGLALSNGHAAISPIRDSWLRVPQRFGCDFKKVDAGGNTLPSPFPNEITNAMFYGYGAECWRWRRV